MTYRARGNSAANRASQLSAVPGAGHPASKRKFPHQKSGLSGLRTTQVVAAIGDLGALEHPQRHIGPEAE